MNSKHKDILAQCRSTRDSIAAKAFRTLFEEQIERWKEDMVSAPADQVEQYRGAIQKVRQVLNKIDRDPREESQGDGGYR